MPVLKISPVPPIRRAARSSPASRRPGLSRRGVLTDLRRLYFIVNKVVLLYMYNETTELETEMASDDKKGMRKREVPAVTRAVAILRALGRSEEPMGVNPLARQLELVPSTALHILRVLTDEGLVAFDPATKRYSIDVGILAIARSAIPEI